MTNVASDNEDNTATTSATVFGSKERETKNAIRYTTGWGVIYIPKTQLEKIGNPDNIKITVEAQV